MLRYIVVRLLSLVPVVLLVSIIAFGLLRLLPGDPVDVMFASSDASTPELRAAVRAEYGLDQPLPLQYLNWLGRALTGDLGHSIKSGDSVAPLILQKLPATIEVAFFAMLIALALALPLGLLASMYRNSWIDYVASVVSMLGISIPSFVLGPLLVLVFAVSLHWVPAIGYTPFFENPLENLLHLLLPAFTLGVGLMASLTRVFRAQMVEELGREYTRTARAKGRSYSGTTIFHVLKNSLIPIVTVVGIQFIHLLGGVIVVETIFAWPGAGSLIVNSIFSRDYPVVQGAILLITVISVLINLVVDLLYHYLDPRLRFA